MTALDHTGIDPRAQEIHDAVTDCDIVDWLVVSPKARDIAQSVLSEVVNFSKCSGESLLKFVTEHQREKLVAQITEDRT